MHTGEISVTGSVDIGTGLEIVERVAEAKDVDGLRHRQTLEHSLVPNDVNIAFDDQGLTQAYIVFGQPGAGKTYFIRKILRQLLALNDDEPDRRFGGLVIDPKGDYPRFVSNASRRSKHRDISPVMIYPGMRKPINILHCGLSPENLARIIAASCKALAKSADDYFHNNLAVVLSALLSSQSIVSSKTDGRAPSMRWLLDTLSGYSDKGGKRRRKLEEYVEMLRRLAEPRGVRSTDEASRPGPKRFHPKLRGRAPADLELTNSERREVARSADNLQAFLREEKAYVVEQLFKQAFEDFQKLSFLSGESSLDQANLYDDIINTGRIVTVSIPPSETYARSVFTLMKSIFQKVVLDRFARFDPQSGSATTITNNQRPVFLICDEYHLSASDSPQSGVGDSTFLSLARAFGCFSLFATQGLEQLKTSPIGERWEAVVGLFRAKIFFTVGDSSTASFASDIAGEQQSVFVATSMNEGVQGKSWGMSDQLSVSQNLPRYIVLSCLGRGQAAIVGSLDGVSPPKVRVASI